MNTEIEEMAKVIGDADQRCYEIDDCNSCPFHHMELGLCKERFVADALYNEDYRKQKVGRWHYDEENECFVCDCGCSALNNYRGLSVNSNFCPNCGAKMEGDSDA